VKKNQTVAKTRHMTCQVPGARNPRNPRPSPFAFRGEVQVQRMKLVTPMRPAASANCQMARASNWTHFRGDDTDDTQFDGKIGGHQWLDSQRLMVRTKVLRFGGDRGRLWGTHLELSKGEP
jgi:hypothetical protein